MIQEKKRIRSVWKYHFENVKICVETDVIFTRCRKCKQLFPSNLEYFRKDSSKDAQRLIQPLCKTCWRELDKEQREFEKMKKIEEQKPITNVEEHSLFEDSEQETMESKIDKIFNFLWLNRWTCKK